jgi:PAS domain S-box-containing protein
MTPPTSTSVQCEFALFCDEDGKLTEVIEDAGVLDSVQAGTSLTTLVDSGSLEKAEKFLSVIQAQGAAFDWELKVWLANQIRSFHFAGGKSGKRVLVVGATSRAALSKTFERVAIEHGFTKRAVVSALAGSSQSDDALYCEMSRLNNELVNAQRELAKNNAEVEQRIEERTKELSEMNRELQQHDALLQSREALLKTFVKNVPAGVAMFDRDMRYLQVSDRWCADYGVDSSQVLGRSHYELFPDVPDRWKEVHCRALEGETLRADEECWDRKDGTSLWVRWEVRPWRTSNALIGGILIFAEDITRRKQMEEAFSGLSRKLIEAQEQERKRIGRELHDDINQQLAMLAFALEQLQDNPAEIGSRLQELRKQTTELSNDVQALSHELHSSKLEYLGVVSGIKSWCKEFGERQAMKIDFKSDVSTVVPLDIGISLFRVLQEALHNALKHSSVKSIEVQLHEESGEIHLTIRDLGKGFDIEAARQGRGLGLTSMQERVRLVNGTIAIDSKPMAGTTIHVRVPVESKHEAQRAAG